MRSKSMPTTENQFIFKKNIIIILTHVYENTPSPTRFCQSNIHELTGYDGNQEDGNKDVVKFLQTVDFLIREGYLRSTSQCVQYGMNQHEVVVFQLPIYITEFGINKLERYNKEEKISTRYIDVFKKAFSSITGKVAENVSSEMVTGYLQGFF